MSTQNYNEIIEREFGYFNRDIAYFNIASICMPPMCSRNALASYYDKFVISRNGDHSMLEGYAMANETRRKIAEYINCKPDEVAYVANTNAGITVIAEAWPWQKGDSVIILDSEMMSNSYIWKHLGRLGVELRVVKTRDSVFDVEDIRKLMDETTKLVSISAVGYHNGFMADLRAVGELCRSRGVVFVVDGIQAAGRLRLDMQEMKIDFLSVGCHKAMLAAFGCGFIYCRRELMDRLVPAHAAMQSVSRQLEPAELGDTSVSLSWFDDARKFEAGSLPQVLIYVLSNAMDLFFELGPENCERRVLGLEDELRKQLIGLDSFHVVGGLDKPEKNRSGIVVLEYPPEAFDEAERILRENRIYITHSAGFMRIAIGIHNNAEQISKLSEALRAIDGVCRSQAV